MMEISHCTQCNATLPEDAPRGLCPACLLQGGLQQEPPADAVGDMTAAHDPAAAAARFTPPSVESLAEAFPQLEILELIGQGGMGAVYRARQKSLDRIVALKILPPSLGDDPAFAERFSREARTLARLSHPHIVIVHESGKSGDFFYLLMEYVDGANLRDAITTRQLSPAEALLVVPQICDALQYAHNEGIVHRDIKPENVLLNRNGQVKIADFGLAKLLGRVALQLTLTQSQQVLGTFHYMAPEQLEQPLDVDHRADIYSLGVVFYELLTGHLPLGRFALPSEESPVDGRLDQVVLKTLERKPDERYQHASDLKTDVESIARSPAPREPARPATPVQQTMLPPVAHAAPPAEMTQEQWESARRAVQVPGMLLIALGVLVLAVPILVVLLGLGFFTLTVPVRSQQALPRTSSSFDSIRSEATTETMPTLERPIPVPKIDIEDAVPSSDTQEQTTTENGS